MYIYSKKDGIIKVIDYIDTDDTYKIEERVLHLVRNSKVKGCREVYDFTTRFTGIYTIYDMELDFTILTSKYLLNEDGTIKSTNPNEPIQLPVKKKRRRRKKTQEENTEN